MAALALVVGCGTVKNTYCNSDSDCTDKSAPFCDSDGTITEAHTCIACPVTGCPADAAVDSSSGDAAADAAVDAPGPALGLGKVCEAATCPSSASNCIQVLGAGTKFCTLTCGTTPTTTPPGNGDMVCMQATPAPGAGTPSCSIYGPDGSGQNIWYCAIKCGTEGGTSYGGCPAGLVCSPEHYCN